MKKIIPLGLWCCLSAVLCGVSIYAMQVTPDLSLHFAAEQGFIYAIETLARQGYSLETRDGRGATPMHWAAIEGKTAAVKRLYELGGEIDACDNSGLTPLHLAAWARYPQTVFMLIACGADVNKASVCDRRTPLHQTIASDIKKRSCRRVVKILLEHGAVINVRDLWWEFPFETARRYGERAAISLLGYIIKSGT